MRIEARTGSDPKPRTPGTLKSHTCEQEALAKSFVPHLNGLRTNLKVTRRLRRNQPQTNTSEQDRPRAPGTNEFVKQILRKTSMHTETSTLWNSSRFCLSDSLPLPSGAERRVFKCLRRRSLIPGRRPPGLRPKNAVPGNGLHLCPVAAAGPELPQDDENQPLKKVDPRGQNN